MMMMKEFNIPQYFTGEEKEIPPAYIFPYRVDKSTDKNRVVLTTHMFSFLKEGNKEIVMGDGTIKLNKSEFVLITAGKCFMSEKISDKGSYSTTLFFFDNDLLQSFFEIQKVQVQQRIKKNKLTQKEVLLFKNDDFTRSYIQSLNYIANRSEELARLKLHEIMLYLLETQPLEFCCLFAEHPKTSEEIKFKNIITSHIDSNLSINELAYLCNVSLSTFKRKFTAVFNDSPTSWIRQKRMEHAAFLLKYNKERVSDIYLRLGYENHSSFSQSFKSVFGVSPKEYQLHD
jgi:AraC family transcriptional regulator, exoenzyme S synthesis regulatory protein ExsA